jgi:hypothetical protein
MTESGYNLPVGRKPLVGRNGERLSKYAVKLYPSQWEWLASVGGSRERSEVLRDLIERSRAGRKRADGSTDTD